VLIPVPDHDFDVTEVSVPWRLLTRAGYDVVFATEHGGNTPAGDARLLSGVIFGQLGAAAEAKLFYDEMVQSPEFQSTVSWSDVDPNDFHGLILPGGHAPGMRQYLGSESLQHTVAGFWQLQTLPVGAICHGVLVLARTTDPATGTSVIAAKRTTSLTKWQERSAYYMTAWKLGRYYRTYPLYVEDEVKQRLNAPLAQYERGPLTFGKRGTDSDVRAAFCVQDGRYVSARWPGDAYLFARQFIAQLELARETATTRVI
jgi:putative intracellular protease/amidase